MAICTIEIWVCSNHVFSNLRVHLGVAFKLPKQMPMFYTSFVIYTCEMVSSVYYGRMKYNPLAFGLFWLRFGFVLTIFEF